MFKVKIKCKKSIPRWPRACASRLLPRTCTSNSPTTGYTRQPPFCVHIVSSKYKSALTSAIFPHSDLQQTNMRQLDMGQCFLICRFFSKLSTVSVAYFTHICLCLLLSPSLVTMDQVDGRQELSPDGVKVHTCLILHALCFSPQPSRPFYSVPTCIT